MIDYTIKINNGNENIGNNAKSITVKEKVRTAGVKDLLRNNNNGGNSDGGNTGGNTGDPNGGND